MSQYTEGMSLEQRLARIEAYIDIQNLMSKYAYYHTANLHQECMELFALDTEDTWSEMTWGRYCGREGLERLYPGFHNWVDGDITGQDARAHSLPALHRSGRRRQHGSRHLGGSRSRDRLP